VFSRSLSDILRPLLVDQSHPQATDGDGDGGRTELFGTMSYTTTTTAGKLAPMFVTTDASIYVFFGAKAAIPSRP